MMSLATIQDMNLDRVKEARENDKRPMEISEAEFRTDLSTVQEGGNPSIIRHIPNLGDPDLIIDILPEYELVESLFVDKGGLGLWDSGGPALSIGGFIEKGLELTKEHGTLHWMLGSEGQFQIYIFALRKLVD